MVKAAKRRSSTGQIWIVAGTGVLAVGLLIGASLWGANAQQAADGPVIVPAVKADADLQADRMTMGKPGPKAHLVEYGDFL